MIEKPILGRQSNQQGLSEPAANSMINEAMKKFPEQERSYIEQMVSIKRLYSSESPYRNMADWYLAVRKRILSGKQQSIVVEGNPNTGKTSIAQLIEKAVSSLRDSMGLPIEPYVLHWDDVESEVKPLLIEAREAKSHGCKYKNENYELIMNILNGDPAIHEIFGPRIENKLFKFIPQSGISYGSQFLSVIESVLKWRQADILAANQPFTVCIIDKNGGTAGVVAENSNSKITETKRYASQFTQQLAECREYPFNRLDRRTFDISAFGSVAGPWMRVRNYYRELIQHAETFEEADIIRELFGLGRFTDQEEWRMSREGGSVAQVRNARMAARIQRVWSFPELPSELQYLMNFRYRGEWSGFGKMSKTQQYLMQILTDSQRNPDRKIFHAHLPSQIIYLLEELDNVGRLIKEDSEACVRILAENLACGWLLERFYKGYADEYIVGVNDPRIVFKSKLHEVLLEHFIESMLTENRRKAGYTARSIEKNISKFSQ